MADYQLSIDILGAKELKAAMDQASGVCLTVLKRALDKSALELEIVGRANAPHKKGGLRDSIHTQYAQVVGNNIEARVGTKIVYGRAQEYGTVGMVINSKSKLGKPFQYTGNIRAKLYMKRAKDEIYPKYVKNMEEAVGIIISSLSHGGAI